MEGAVDVSQSRRRRVPLPTTKRHVAAKMLASACRAGALDLIRRLAAGVARKVALTLPSIRTAAAACCAVAVALLLCAAAAYFCRRGVSARRGRGRIKAGERQKQAALIATNANPSPPPGAATAREQPAAQEPPPAPAEPVASESETPSRSMETEQELVDTNTPGGAMATSDQLPAGNQKDPPLPSPSPRRTARPRQPSRRYSSSEWVL